MSLLHQIGLKAIKTLPPEPAHRMAIKALKLSLGPLMKQDHDPILTTSLAGLSLPNPIGLAAGFDKDCEVPDAMLRAGFGFVEMGSVTPRPQAGNPKPRLFRLSEDQAVINRMGFNNHGLDAFANRLKARQDSGTGIVGANLGANKDSEDRAADYITGLRRLWGHCDYFTINISSPNTPGLRKLQSDDALDDLLGRINEVREALRGEDASPPIFLKVAPDLDDPQIETITQLARQYGLSGLIISNTTLARPDTLQSQYASQNGGLSGAPLFAPSTRVLASFYEASEGRMPLIGVGGIATGAQAYGKIRAGASAVQLYSALIYQGPVLAQIIAKDVAERLRADGFNSVQEAVGTRRP